ncbi:Large tegument protein deneddylase, partial [Bienertia sinuspersici]
ATVDTGAIVTEEISAKDISVTDNAIGDDSKDVDEGVSVSSPKDGQLIVADAGAMVVLLRHLRVTKDDGSYSSVDRSARIPDVAIPEYIPQNTPEKKIILLLDEDIKKELGEEVGKNVMEDVGMANCDIIVSRTLQLQRNKVQDVSILSVDENNPAVIQQNEELRHTLECSVLLDIVNPANPDMHVCMTKTDFLSLAPKTWLTGASIDACSYLFNRREEKILELPEDFEKKKEKIESIIAEKEIDLEKAKDNPCYDTMKAEWLKDKQKMTYRESAFFADKCRQSMSEWEKIVMFCKVFCKVIESSVVVLMVFTIGIEGLFLLLGEVIKMTLIVVFIVLKLWNGMTVGMRKASDYYTFNSLYKEFKSMSSCYRFGSYKENRRKRKF